MNVIVSVMVAKTAVIRKTVVVIKTTKNKTDRNSDPFFSPKGL